VAAATARSDKLTQAILAKAFRGEPAPTEAELARREGRDCEPASVLLERIRAEPAVHQLGKPSRRAKKCPEESSRGSKNRGARPRFPREQPEEIPRIHISRSRELIRPHPPAIVLPGTYLLLSCPGLLPTLGELPTQLADFLHGHIHKNAGFSQENADKVSETQALEQP
jgi:hypothetical protein